MARSRHSRNGQSSATPTGGRRFPCPPSAAIPRTVLLAVLLAVALAAALVLAAAPCWVSPVHAAPQGSGAAAGKPTASGAGPKVAAITHDAAHRKFFLVAFDQPVGKGKLDAPLPRADSPIAIAPQAKGEWRWISPFVLRFDADEPLKQYMRYRLTFDEARLFGPGVRLAEGATAWLKTGSFVVESIHLEQVPDPADPSRIRIDGHVSFNQQVDPKEMISFFTCTDQRGAKQEIRIRDNYKSSYIYFTVGPVTPTPEKKLLSFRVAPGLKAHESQLELERETVKTTSIWLDPTLTVAVAEAQALPRSSGIALEFSAPVSLEAARRALRVTPDVPFTISLDERKIRLTGKFLPGQDYVLRLEKGLAAVNGARLPKTESLDVTMPDLDPTLDFQGKGLFLSRHGNRTLGIEHVNAEECQVNLERIHQNNIFYYFASQSSSMLMDDDYYRGDIEDYLGDRLAERNMTLAGEPNVIKTTPLPLDSLVPQGEKGLFRVTVGFPGEWDRTQRFVLFTDLGVVAKMGLDECMVHVASLSSLAPQEKVKVSLLSHQNQVIASGETGDQGVWETALDRKVLEKHKPYMLVAEKGDDMTFLLFDQFRADQTGQDVGGLEVAQAGYTAFLHGERDLYRPGETAKGLILLRDADLKNPPAMPLKLRHKDPRGQELNTQVVQSDDKGQAQFSLDIPGFALTGPYTLECLVGDKVAGRYRYQVEEFLPDRIKVDVTSPDVLLRAGQELTYGVESAFFFGPPAAGLPMETRVRLKAAPFTAKKFQGYLFGNAEHKFEDQEIHKHEGTLDDSGRAALKVALPANVQPPAALEAEIVARVRERGGRGVAARLSRVVHPYSRYVGVKQLEKTGVAPGEPMTFQYVLVTPEGELAAGGDGLTVDVWRDEWQTVLRRSPSGGHRYESERQSQRVERFMVQTSGPQGSFEWTPPQFGSYRVVVTDPGSDKAAGSGKAAGTDKGASTQVSFYAGGWGYSPWAMENPATLEIVPDKTDYKPGETATFQIRAPFGGRLLVTVEKDRVLDMQLHDVPGNTATVSFPVKAEYSPNVYVGAVLVRSARDIEPGMVARAVGWTPFLVDRDANKAAVTFDLPEVVRPNAGLDIALKTQPGATVTLAAVDEGILQLINQKTPDPFAHFYAKRALELDTYDTFAMLLPEINPEGVAPAGGDGGREGQFVRTDALRRVKPVSFWSGPLTAGEDGAVRWKVDLPEFNGAVRVMAVVAGGKVFGSGQAQVKVRAPLVLSATLPRFLSFDDQAVVPVSLRNDLGQDQDFQVRLELSGPGAANQTLQPLRVAQGREGLAFFTIATRQEEGWLNATVTAEGGGHTAREEVEFMVRAPLPARTLVQSGAMQGRELTLPSQGGDFFLPGTVTREAHIGNFPLLRYASSLKELLEYPHGCAEQTTSRVFPLLYHGDLAAALAPGEGKGGGRRNTPAALINAGIRRLQTMQTTDGGFAFWPGGREASPWVSAYVGHFLVEARMAGHQVPEAMHRDALRHLADLLQGDDAPYEARTYAAFVLAKAGRPDKGSMEYLLEEAGLSLRPLPNTLLRAAMALAGDKQALKDLLAQPQRAEAIPRASGGVFDSAIRNLALRILVLRDALPGDARLAPMVQELVKRMDATSYRSTQENAFAFLALGAWFHDQKAKGPFTGVLSLGEETLAAFTDNATLSLTGAKAIRDDRPLILTLDPGVPATAQEGAVFYTVMSRGLPRPAAHKAQANGMELEQAFLTRDGKPLDLQQIKQGQLVVMRTSLKAPAATDNVALSTLLPAGLEVENPRLATTEKLAWVDKAATPDHQDIRDDRVVSFLRVPKGDWLRQYTLLRAVTVGQFQVPPPQAEAMYDPEIMAVGGMATLRVLPDAPAPAPPAPVAPAIPSRTVTPKTSQLEPTAPLDSPAEPALAQAP